MVNNFDQIKSILKFETPEDFYYVAILRRKADDPAATKSVKVVDQYAIHSLEDFDKLKEDIIRDCELFKARAYVYLNKRNIRKVSLEAIKYISDCIWMSPKASRLAFWRATGRTCAAGKDKTWIVDIDTQDPDELNRVKATIASIREATGQSQHIADHVVPTKKGYHIIAKPFDRNMFSRHYPNIDIHKDSPTVLYSYNETASA